MEVSEYEFRQCKFNFLHVLQHTRSEVITNANTPIVRAQVTMSAYHTIHGEISTSPPFRHIGNTLMLLLLSLLLALRFLQR